MQETEKTLEKQPERQLSATCTLTTRIDRETQKRLQTESAALNLPVSTYAASMIKECWQLREKVNTLQDVELLPKPDVSDANKQAVDLEKLSARLDESLNNETAASMQQFKALVYLRSRFRGYTDEQLIAAALMNVAANETAFLFVTDYSTTLKKISHEA